MFDKQSVRERACLGALGACLAALLAFVCAVPASHAQHASAPRPIGAVFPSLPTVLRLSVGLRSTYRLYHWSFRLSNVELDLVRVRDGRSLAALAEQQRATLVVNAGFFDSRRRPIGLSLARGTELTPYSERLRGGVLTVADGRATLHSTEGFARPAGTDFALQAKPPLVTRGHVARFRSHVRRADRTAICLRRGGTVLDFYVARSRHPRGHGGPTLAAFAHTLQSLGCEAALNLDGGRSTGAAWRVGASMRSMAPRDPVAQAIVIRKVRGPAS